MSGKAPWAETDRAKAAVMHAAIDGIRAEAKRMEEECAHPPCQHAVGLRLAELYVREAARCPDCGEAPGVHRGNCPAWGDPSWGAS